MRMLSWLSLAWMGAEGVIAIAVGMLAGSIALIAFGIDSAEKRAQKLVAIQFFLLAPYGGSQADHP